MLNAQSGSPAGMVSAACALSSRTMRESGAKAHMRTAMRTNVFARGIRRITGDLLFRSRRRSAVSCPGEGDEVYQNRQLIVALIDSRRSRQAVELYGWSDRADGITPDQRRCD